MQLLPSWSAQDIQLFSLNGRGANAQQIRASCSSPDCLGRILQFFVTYFLCKKMHKQKCAMCRCSSLGSLSRILHFSLEHIWLALCTMLYNAISTKQNQLKCTMHWYLLHGTVKLLSVDGIGFSHVAPGLSQHAINHIIVSDIHPSALLIVLRYCPNLLYSVFPISNWYCLLLFQSIISFVSSIHRGALCY